MLSRFGLPQVKDGTALHHLFSVDDELLKERFERKCLWHSANERHCIEVECLLKLGVLVEEVENLLWETPLFEVNDHSHIFRGLVAKTFDAVNFLLADEVRDSNNHFGLVHSVRN